MTAIVDIVSIHGHTTNVCHRKQSSKSKLALHKLLLSLYGA